VSYSYITVAVSICRDFDEDAGMQVIDENPIRTLRNLVVDGRAVVELRALLGRARDFTNYIYPVATSDGVKHRTCFVIRKYYLKLPRPMDLPELQRFSEEVAGVKLPVKPGSEEMFDLLESLYRVLKPGYAPQAGEPG